MIQQNLIATYPATDAGFGVRIAPYLVGVVSDYSTTVWLLEGAVACLLLITCANVANLLLRELKNVSRGSQYPSRPRCESRSRLVLQLLTESAVLSVGEAILGVGIAIWSLQAIKTADSSNIPRVHEVTVDNGSLAFVLLIMLLTALASGLFPAWTGVNLASALSRESERAGGLVTGNGPSDIGLSAGRS